MKKLLSDLNVGDIGIIRSINMEELKKRRLFHLGVMKDNSIVCKFKSMFNDPIAYQVNNTIFTLRKKDASKIEVTYEWNKY